MDQTRYPYRNNDENIAVGIFYVIKLIISRNFNISLLTIPYQSPTMEVGAPDHDYW
jgi:hypothetical protein